MLEHFKLNWEFEPQHKINICELLLVVALSKKRKRVISKLRTSTNEFLVLINPQFAITPAG